MRTRLVLLAAATLLVLAACSATRTPAARAVKKVDSETATERSDDADNSHTASPKESTEPEPAPLIKKGFVVTTGVHGNEPSGYYVQDQLAELGFNVYGPCNPWGIENNNRHLEDGRDLNRMFGRNDCPEAETIKEWLTEQQPEFLLDLHEDPDGTGAYLIQHGPDDDIGRRIIDELKDEFEFDPEPKFMMVTGEDGLLKPELNVLRLMALAKIYGLGYWVWANFNCTAIVVECPSSWDVEKRKRYQLAVCKTARRLFEETAAAKKD